MTISPYTIQLCIAIIIAYVILTNQSPPSI